MILKNKEDFFSQSKHWPDPVGSHSFEGNLEDNLYY